MNRRDRLTYDLGPERTQPSNRPSVPMIALLIAVVAIAVLLVVWTLRSPSAESDSINPPGQPSAGPSADAQQTPDVTATPPSSRAGSDAEAVDDAPEGSATAAEQFVLAWLERDPDARESALAEVAAPGLVEQLMLTSSANIPDTSPDGDPVLQGASAYSVEFDQSLEGDSKIRIYLVSDPEAHYGWLATSVEQA